MAVPIKLKPVNAWFEGGIDVLQTTGWWYLDRQWLLLDF